MEVAKAEPEGANATLPEEKPETLPDGHTEAEELEELDTAKLPGDPESPPKDLEAEGASATLPEGEPEAEEVKEVAKAEPEGANATLPEEKPETLPDGHTEAEELE